MLAALALTLVASPQATASEVDPRQVLWQRDLDDALALARASGRPLFVAVNMDGEAASDRIVVERYRDPDWVASTRPFVCVVASAFRHSAVDYDAQGRRVPCPRLGEVTCGEHSALEPLVHARFLAGERVALFGERVDRVSPRHALIAPDGTKSFDLFLLFDLRDLDRALAGEAAQWPGPCLEAASAPYSHRGRLAFEDGIAARPAREALRALLDRVHFELPADHGWTPALRRLLPRAHDVAPHARALADVAHASNTREAALAAVRERVLGAGDAPGTPGSGRDAALLPLLASLVGDTDGDRTSLLSFAALSAAGEERARARDALAAMFGEATAADIERAVASAGGPFDPLAFFERARTGTPPPRAPGSAADEIPALESALDALDAADRALAEARDDPERRAAFGRASLALARRRVADGQASPEIELLLEDAERWLAQASDASPLDARLLLERARIAYMRSRFDEQEELALRALAALRAPWRAGDAAALDDPAVEALRWLGDAGARLLGARSGGDPSIEALGILRAGRALALAAASRESDATDWVSLASFCGALGRAREQIAFAGEGVRRYPASEELRAAFADALWRAGRLDVLAERSEALADGAPGSAHGAWYAGYALVLRAEQLRREQRPLDAVAAYERAELRFRRALELEPSFRDSSEHYLALSALGRGHALIAAGRRLEASRAAVEAAAIRPAIFAVKDGLGREGVDLVDGVLEWTADGPSPVDARDWLAELEAAAPDQDLWARSISDAELREALRAYGRDEPEHGEALLRSALEAARRANAARATQQNSHALAQAATTLAEALLDRRADDSTAEIRSLLTEAARAAETDPPGADDSLEALRAQAVALREKLGARRPVFRPGR
jgi:hypothetical protein